MSDDALTFSDDEKYAKLTDNELEAINARAAANAGRFTPDDLRRIRERNERLRAEAASAENARAKAESDELFATLAAFAEKQVAAFRELPCGGEVAKVSACADDYAASCERRNTPSCPRSIIAFDAQVAAEQLRERLANSGVPQRVRDAVGAEFYQTKATVAVDEWLASGKCLLLLAGGFGTGKSVAAGYALKRRPGLWMHASEMVAIADDDRFHSADRLKSLKRARVLVIDEIGKEQDSGSVKAKAAITSLILTRFEEKLPTIMTNNFGGAEWKAYVDPRITDRLAGDGMVFGTAGESLRRRK